MAQQKQLGQQAQQAQQADIGKQMPTKESVRSWLRSEIAQRRPPPDPAQIRRELGWELIPVLNERKR